jgi:hypothetical protein
LEKRQKDGENEAKHTYMSRATSKKEGVLVDVLGIFLLAFAQIGR